MTTMSPVNSSFCALVLLCIALYCSSFVLCDIDADLKEFKSRVVPQFETKFKDFAAEALEKDKITDLFTGSRGGRGEHPSILHIGGLEKMLRDLIFNVDLKYSKVTAGLKSLKREFEKNMQDGVNSVVPRLQKPCCTPAPGEEKYVGRYRDVVNVDRECVGRTEDTANEQFLLHVDDALSLMKTNYENSTSILWQYLATVDGHYAQFPSKNRYCEGSNIVSPLTQRWMVNKLLQEKLNLVILVDAGAHMESYVLSTPPLGPPGSNPGAPSPPLTHWDMVKHATRRLLKELTALDRVTVLVMNGSTVAYPPGCTDRLLVATDRNADLMSSFVDGIIVQDIRQSGQLDLAVGLQEAYRMLNLEKSKQNMTQTDDVILLLTNGEFIEPDEPKVLEAVKTGQDSLGKRVYHIIYTIKSYNHVPSLELLTRLADLNNNILTVNDTESTVNTSWPEDYSGPVGPLGQFTIVPQESRFTFSDIVADFYHFFPHGARGTSARITALEPQQDSKVGLIQTFAIPLFNGTAVHPDFLYGVAAIDASMASLFDDVIHFKLGVHSYCFLVEAERGLVLVHPKLEKPYRLTENDPVFSTMEFIEPTFTEQQRQAILAANSSYLTFEAQVQPGRSTYKTGQDFESVARVPVTVMYSWLPSTDYIFVLVAFHSDLSLDQTSGHGSLGFPGVALYHHQLVINQTADGVCAREGNFRVQDKVTVKFSPDVFTEPELYMYSREPPSAIRNMTSFLTEDGPPPPTFRQEALDGILADLQVVSSHALARMWQANNASGVVERFIGTPNGVFASYPGISLPNAFDDQEFDWYRETVARPGSIWVSLRRSLTSTVRRVDVATTLHEGDRIFGITGVSISRRSFAGLFFNSVEYCLNEGYTCHLMTADGYLMEVLDMTPLPVLQRHIAEVYPWLAKVLLQRTVMKPLWCTVLSEGRHRQTYTLRVTDNVMHETSVKETCRQFLVQRVSNTNLFVLVLAGRQKEGCGESATPLEHCSKCNRMPGAGLLECDTCLASPAGTPTCQCPCHCEGDFDECQDSFQHMDGATFPLTPCYEEPEMPNLNNAGPDRPSPATPPCAMRCPAFETKEDCESVPACQWMENDPYPVCETAVTTTTTSSTPIRTKPPSANPSTPAAPSPTAALRTTTTKKTEAPGIPVSTPHSSTGAGEGSNTTDGNCSDKECRADTDKQKSNGDAERKLSGGAVAGIVVGVVASLAVAGVVGYTLFRPRLFGRLKEVDLPETPDPYNRVQYTADDPQLQLTRTPVTPSEISAAPATTAEATSTH